jgi:hypothetical protein
MKKQKIYALIIFIMAMIGLSAQVFNHLNPWAGIAIEIASALFTINYIQKQIKQNENK